VYAGDGPTLIGNTDINTTLWLGQNNAITAGRVSDTIQLTPQSWVVVDGKETIYGITSGPSVYVNLIPGGLAFFQSGITGGGFIVNGQGAFFYNGAAGPGRLIVAITGTTATGIDQYGNHYVAGGIWVSNANGIIGGSFAINSNGAFFYNGAPGSGNLIVAITGATASGADQYGNTYQPGTVTVFDPAIMLFPSKQAFELQAALIQSEFSPPAVNQFLQLLLQGPSTTTAGARDSVAIELNSASKDNTSNANLEIIYNGSAGGAHEYAFCDATGFNVVAGMNDPPDPATLPGAVGIENWHPFTLSNGSAGTDSNGVLYNPAYKLYSDGHVGLKGVYVSPAGGLGSGTTIAVIPNFPQYRPTANIPTALVANAAHGTLVHVYIRPNGNVQFNGALGASVGMLLDCTLNMRLQ
jgi:hypothetical protein